jgi:hypothetical protein
MAPVVMSHSRLHIILSAFKSAELDVSRHHLFWYYSRISLLILQSYDGIMTIMTLKRVVVMKCVCIHINTSSSPYLNDVGRHTGLVNINILLLGLLLWFSNLLISAIYIVSGKFTSKLSLQNIVYEEC